MTTRPPFALIKKLQDRKHHHRQRHRVFRVLWALAGIGITIVGLVMFITPGPAMIVLPFGLYLLALEFDWAERLLHLALDHADRTVRSSFVSGTVQFVKRHPTMAALILVLLITAGAGIFILLWKPAHY